MNKVAYSDAYNIQVNLLWCKEDLFYIFRGVMGGGKGQPVRLKYNGNCYNPGHQYVAFSFEVTTWTNPFSFFFLSKCDRKAKISC